VGPGLRAVVGQAAGNPLYVREMVDALIRDGRLRREGGTAELVVAAELLGRAVAHTGPEDPRREQLQAMLASVLVMLGRREEAVQLAERVRAATRDPTRAAQASWTLARALGHLARYKQARAVLTDALRDPGADRVWTARMRALRSEASVSGGDFDQVAAAREALTAAEQVGDRLATALASNALCLSLSRHGGGSAALAVVTGAGHVGGRPGVRRPAAAHVAQPDGRTRDA
jgi:hypothetical protein